MANPEHLEILKQGPEAWNRWREKHPSVGPDLSGAELSGVKLSGVDFSLAYKNKYVAVGAAWAGMDVADVVEGGEALRADLRKAKLADARLGKADLFGADFSEADLHSADLQGAQLTAALLGKTNLHKAKLNEATLRGADLTDANLSEAHLADVSLRKASLSRTNFSGAYLARAVFRNAHLADTVFRKADLTGADFGETYLHGADFSEARIGRTTFGLTRLDTAKGLETVVHSGPSIISIETIYRSEGNIPEKFLRGCGVPESFIVQIPALVASTQPIQFYSCFISYSSTDQEFAERLHADLQAKGVRVWYAPHDLPIGAKIRPATDESIRLHDKLLLVLSETSASSQWVEQEVETALAKEREQEGRTVLFPIRIDDAVMEIKSGWPALLKNTRNVGDFTDWKDHDSYREAFDRLLRDLRAGA